MLRTILNNSNDILHLTYKSFFLSTFAIFKECNTPKRKPDYVSRDKKGRISSEYWYGSNKQGEYVIRRSNHWSSYIDNKNTTTIQGCGTIGKTDCFWSIKFPITQYEEGKYYTAKAYFKTFKDIK